MFAVYSLRRMAYFFAIAACFIIFSASIHTEERNDKELIVIMYHSILKDTQRTGKYVVRPESVDNDIKYLIEHGYKCVSANEVISFSRGEANLPDKAFMLTFDDGCYNNMVYLMPILEKYNANAVISIVGSYSEKFSKINEANAAYSYLRWCDIKQMKESGRIEFGNHSYDYHKIKDGRIGSKIVRYEDTEKYKNRFFNDTNKTHTLLMVNCGIDTKIYTYPYGAYCTESEEVLKDSGYLMTLTCTEGKNYITSTPESIKLLKRFNRSGNINTEDFFEKHKIY
ncbi:MAG: polysaccharide deacetylase family protein [Eubacteriales bacterium]|nr:polysaccharide deacetylase family protein [Eubacteriales bacterium]